LKKGEELDKRAWKKCPSKKLKRRTLVKGCTRNVVSGLDAGRLVISGRSVFSASWTDEERERKWEEGMGVLYTLPRLDWR